MTAVVDRVEAETVVRIWRHLMHTDRDYLTNMVRECKSSPSTIIKYCCLFCDMGIMEKEKGVVRTYFLIKPSIKKIVKKEARY